MTRSQLDQLILKAALTHAAIGEALHISRTAVSNKLAGRRPWLDHEIVPLLALLGRRLGRRVTFEAAFPTKRRRIA